MRPITFWHLRVSLPGELAAGEPRLATQLAVLAGPDGSDFECWSNGRGRLRPADGRMKQSDRDRSEAEPDGHIRKHYYDVFRMLRDFAPLAAARKSRDESRPCRLDSPRHAYSLFATWKWLSDSA